MVSDEFQYVERKELRGYLRGGGQVERKRFLDSISETSPQRKQKRIEEGSEWTRGSKDSGDGQKYFFRFDVKIL